METIGSHVLNGQQRVLIIEDDPKIAQLVEIHLRDLGCAVDPAPDGLSGLALLDETSYALVVLDLSLPGIDGIEVCKRIRARNAFMPIVMLTARSEELDVVLGLELGADDYITKPFSVRELIARIKAVFRRIETEQRRTTQRNDTERMVFGRLVIDPPKRKVTLSGAAIELTAKEYDLLELFASHPGRVYSRSELLELVWGYHFDGYDHTVNSLINRLRRKIENDPARPVFIKTMWGVGYRFAEPDEVART